MCMNITAVPTTCQRTDTDFKEKMFLFWDVKYGEQIWSWKLEYKNTKNHQRESWIKIYMKADVLEFWTCLHHNSICYVPV